MTRLEHRSRTSQKRDPGYLVLTLLLFIAVAGFLPVATMTGGGILQAVADGGAAASAGTPPSAIPYLLIDVVGVVLLGLGLAYGVYRYHTRDRRLDPLTEAATKAQYDEKSGPTTTVEPEDRPSFGAEREGLGTAGDRDLPPPPPSAPRVGGTP